MICPYCSREVQGGALLHVLHCEGQRYPEGAGYKEPTTSREAAESIDASTLRDQVFQCLLRHGPMTTDECAARLSLSVLAVRPRFSELRALGHIADSGVRRENQSGRRAAVWKVLREMSL